MSFLMFIAGIGIGFLHAVLRYRTRMVEYRMQAEFWSQKYAELFDDYESVCSQYEDLREEKTYDDQSTDADAA